MDVKLSPGVPETEFSQLFVQGMADRMSLSYAKYGAVADGFPARVDAIATLKVFLARYEQDGNRERLMDLANYAMIEFMHPRHPQAHYRPTDTKESPGRQWHGEVDRSQRANRPERWTK